MRDYCGYRKQYEKRRKRNRLIAILMGVVLLVVGYISVKNKNKNKPVIDNNEPAEEEQLGEEEEKKLTFHDAPWSEEDNKLVVHTIVATPTPEPVITPEPTPIPTPEPAKRPTNGGDTVIASSDVNMRLSATDKSFKIGTLYKGSIVNRVYTDGEWDLVSVDGVLVWVNTRYTNVYEQDFNYEYYDVEEYKDIVRTTSALNFRTGPSKNEKQIFMLNKKEQVVVIGKATIRNNPNEVWYIAKARGKIGFISAAYTQSIRSEIQRFAPMITDIEFEQIARCTKFTGLTDPYGNTICNINQFQLVNIIEQYQGYSLAEYNGNIGFIQNNTIKVIPDAVLACDKSEQRVYYYVNGEIAFIGRCTTGKKGSETDNGFFKPYGKSSYHDFGHDGYEAKILWMPFNGGQGFHDASWEKDSKFGDKSYTDKHGSAGCVRLPNAEAHFIYENVPKSTSVLIMD